MVVLSCSSVVLACLVRHPLSEAGLCRLVHHCRSPFRVGAFSMTTMAVRRHCAMLNRLVAVISYVDMKLALVGSYTVIRLGMCWASDDDGGAKIVSSLHR